MTSYIRFTPISGAYDEQPLCYLLQIDDANILLDCGWNESMDIRLLENLAQVTRTIDAVVLSHGDFVHLGALPYAQAKLGLSCNYYATIPVQAMGLVSCYEAFHAKRHVETFDLFTLDDVEETFENMAQLRYSQPFILGGKCSGIVLTAYPSGHSIGGTVWKISKDNDDVLYAVDYNHKKERHLNGTILHLGLEALSRPSLLITDTRNVFNQQVSRQIRDQALFDVLSNTIQKGGHVLIPIDASIRILELSYLLDKQWSQRRLTTPLIFFSHHGNSTINIAKSMLEWLGDTLTQAFSQRREAPFYFQSLQVVTNSESLAFLMNQPCVILCSMASMDSGFSFELMHQFSQREENLILLSEKPIPGTTASYFYDLWKTKKDDLFDPKQQKELSITDAVVQLSQVWKTVLKQKVYLEGDELEDYLNQQRLKKEQQDNNQRMRIHEDQLSEMSDDEIEGQLEGAHAQTSSLLNVQYDFYVKDTVKSNSFFKQSTSFYMFPVQDLKRKYDDYGEVIDPQAYMHGEFQTSGIGKGADATADLEKPLPSLMMNEVESKLERILEDKPLKYIEKSVDLLLKCGLVHIDFEGRSDGKSMKNIIQQVAPRKLILVHGSPEATNELYLYCIEHDHITNEVFAPQVGEAVTVSEATNMFQVKLTDSLMSSLQLQDIKDYQVAYIQGIVRYPNHLQAIDSNATANTKNKTKDEGIVPMEEDTEDKENQKASSTTQIVIPSLDLLPIQQQKPHTQVILGDLKLAEFRKLLMQEGYATEFIAGVLILPEHGLLIRKTMTGRLCLEGRFSKEYYQIRTLLYQQHIII